MNREAHQRLFAIVISTLAILAAMMLPTAAHADDDDQEPKLVVGPDNEIYGTQEAFDLVMEARKYDSMFCQGLGDRDNAAELYGKAIAAQPGAKLNGPIADRIAQMYAFNADEKAGIKLEPAKARQWWNRCIELTSPNQLLWAQAQMGLASAAYLSRDYFAALDRCNKILDVDFDNIELPDWKIWPDGDTERDQAILERERDYLRQSIESMRTSTVDAKFSILRHISKDAALDFLQSAAITYKGTPTGKWASDKMTQIRANSQKDPWALPDNFLDNHDPSQPQAQTLLVRQQGWPEGVAPEPVSQTAMAGDSGWEYWGIGGAVCVIVLAALAAVRIVRNRRKNHVNQT